MAPESHRRLLSVIVVVYSVDAVIAFGSGSKRRRARAQRRTGISHAAVIEGDIGRTRSMVIDLLIAVTIGLSIYGWTQ